MFMKWKKEYYFVLVVAIILLAIMVTMIVILFNTRAPEKPAEILIPTSFPTNTPDTIMPPISYDKNAERSLLDRKENRRQLSDADIAAKNKILSLLTSPDVEVVYESANIRVRYIESLNLFKIEILTTDASQAKLEGYNWFRSQGMSHEGICNYPVEFYLNHNVKSELRGRNFIFNSAPEGC